MACVVVTIHVVLFITTLNRTNDDMEVDTQYESSGIEGNAMDAILSGEIDDRDICIAMENKGMLGSLLTLGDAQKSAAIKRLYRHLDMQRCQEGMGCQRTLAPFIMGTVNVERSRLVDWQMANRMAHVVTSNPKVKYTIPMCWSKTYQKNIVTLACREKASTELAAYFSGQLDSRGHHPILFVGEALQYFLRHCNSNVFLTAFYNGLKRYDQDELAIIREIMRNRIENPSENEKLKPMMRKIRDATPDGNFY